MSVVVSVINQKGGVGKTTTSANLSAGLAEKGLKVLVVDVDAQSNLSTHLGLELEVEEESGRPQKGTIYEVLKGDLALKDVIINRSENLDIVPSSLLLSAADLELGGVVGRELLLKRVLQPVKELYDYIVIDCPPALGLLSLNALAASDRVVIPVQSEYLALHGVRQLLDTIDQVRSIYNPSLEVGGVLICMHDNRKRLARAVAETIHNYFGGLVFETVVRANVSLAEAPSNGQTIFEYSPKSTGAEDYAALVEEVLSGKKADNEI